MKVITLAYVSELPQDPEVRCPTGRAERRLRPHQRERAVLENAPSGGKWALSLLSHGGGPQATGSQLPRRFTAAPGIRPGWLAADYLCSLGQVTSPL